jgi:dipeptidyl aminopeptidase/acylaminoacyl peptidase
VVVEVDEEKDRRCSSVWVAAVDGATPPRRFSEGPADAGPRFSPDGRWLAYISVTDDKPAHAHVRLAPLDGGAPLPLGELPGPVSEVAWSPDSRRVVVVCRVGVPDLEDAKPEERNAPRRVRGLGARMDGVGWQEGRRHLFLIDVPDGSTKQLTRGEFDHDNPSFSPDGECIVFASDRTRRRDDRQFRSDGWIMPAQGGRSRRLTNGKGLVSFPRFSPDGELVAFAGHVTEDWDEDSHLFVVPSDGSRQPERQVPDTDRPIFDWSGTPPLHWTGERELTMLLADRGTVTIHRARVGDRRTRELIGGELQIVGLAARVGQRSIAYSAAWVDQPSELFVSAGGRGEATRLTHLNDALAEEVELTPTQRASVTRPDGTEIEYFMLLPPGRRPTRLPVHLEIHGGPHAWWPWAGFLAFHQALAAAGYCVLLPNPRGSASYGQEFTTASAGDWGGGDYEDLLACCDDLIERGIVDPERMFVGGGSYGGFMTNWIVGHTKRFRAATTLAGLSDMRGMALTSDIPWVAQFHFGGTPWQRSEEYDRLSPLTYLPAVTTPVLVIHWEGDLRVPINQGEEIYAGLRTLGKEAEFLRYPGGFHVQITPSQGVDATRQVLDWNQRHDKRRSRRKK